MTYTDPGDSRLGDGGPVDNPPRARSTDPQTSHDAAASMVEGAKAQRERILEILRERGPMNAYEIDKAIGWRETTAGRRLKELAHPNVGLVKMTVHTRATRSPQYQGHLWEVV